MKVTTSCWASLSAELWEQRQIEGRAEGPSICLLTLPAVAPSSVTFPPSPSSQLQPSITSDSTVMADFLCAPSGICRFTTSALMSQIQIYSVWDAFWQNLLYECRKHTFLTLFFLSIHCMNIWGSLEFNIWPSDLHRETLKTCCCY